MAASTSKSVHVLDFATGALAAAGAAASVAAPSRAASATWRRSTTTAEMLSELAVVVGSALELLPMDERAASALAGMTTIASHATQLLTAATAEPPDVSGAILVSISLAKEVGAPQWVLTGLTKVVSVAEVAPRLVSALMVPDVPAAALAVVEISAGVAGTEPWVVTALTSLIAGDVSGAAAVLEPQLQPAVLLSLLANIPLSLRSKVMSAVPSGAFTYLPPS